MYVKWTGRNNVKSDPKDNLHTKWKNWGCIIQEEGKKCKHQIAEQKNPRLSGAFYSSPRNEKCIFTDTERQQIWKQ